MINQATMEEDKSAIFFLAHSYEYLIMLHSQMIFFDRKWHTEGVQFSFILLTMTVLLSAHVPLTWN